ncbi:MAG: thiamine pyrophosphate-binding protein, partial [Pseudomonadota bacterium]|nr:thiamine pyrophosphate-binding protein [Pseudomonadota bacterium]
FSSTGPGAANTIGGLIEARFAGSPVLHITGQTATQFADREVGTVHDAYDQFGMLRAVSKSVYRVRAAGQALGILTCAAAEALTPPKGPVSVEVPIDIQRTKIERPALLDTFSLPLAAPRAPSEAEQDELAARVQRAKRPMLWVGAGARDCSGTVLRLLDLGFTMVNSLQGRGIVPEDHPMSLGALHGNGMPAIQDFYGTVDLMLVVGARLRGQETADFALKLPPNMIQIDIDPLANGRTYPNQYFVCGDARLALEGLVRRIEGTWDPDPNYQAEFADLKTRARADFLETLGAYSGFADQLRAVLPKDALWVRDVTQSHTTWGNRIFPIYEPRQNIYPVGAGIGQGLQLGIGAAAAAGERKTIVMTGDGGFFLNVGELWTAVQERLDLTIVVMNDGGYGVIKRIQDATQQGRRFFADLQNPDLAGLAALTGFPFWKVDRAGAFGETVAKALAHKGVSLVEVDMNAVGEFPAYYPFSQQP